MIEMLIDNLTDRYDDLKKVDEVELLKDIYITIPFSFSSEFYKILPNKDESYIDDVIQGICVNGVGYIFNEQELYMEYIVNITQNVISKIKQMQNKARIKGVL